MKTFTMKKMSIHLATIAVLGALSTPVMAASAVEYGLIAQLISQFGTIPGATEHNQCNQLTPKKSPVNNKSLNPVCNICIGGEDEIAGKYTILTSAGGGSVALLCINTTVLLSVDQVVEFPTQKLTDLQTICDSRGGTFSNVLNAGVLTACSFPAP